MANYIKTNHAVLVLHVMVLILILTLVVFIYSVISSVIRESQNEINDYSKDQWALIIGTDNQSSNSFDDAIKISKRLRSLWGKECVSLALTSNKSTIETLFIEWLSNNEDTDDTVLVYISGHGDCDSIKLKDNDNQISVNEIDNWLSLIESSNICIVFEFCESGCYAKKMQTSKGVILSASTDLEICWQEDFNGHGVFTYLLLEAMSEISTSDKNHDNYISAEELYSYINRKMALEYQNYPPPSPQHPQIIDNYPGELCLFSINRN